jgi:hypothetical protein
MCISIIDVLFVAGLMGVGLWLESINGKRGFVDELLTPWPLGIGGMFWVLLIGGAWI